MGALADELVDVLGDAFAANSNHVNPQPGTLYASGHSRSV